jgi:hypothetical protein
VGRAGDLHVHRRHAALFHLGYHVAACPNRRVASASPCETITGIPCKRSNG